MFALFDQRRDRWIRATDLRVSIMGVVFEDCVMLWQTKERAERAKAKLEDRELAVFQMTMEGRR